MTRLGFWVLALDFGFGVNSWHEAIDFFEMSLKELVFYIYG
jgi:hypothetical protein